MTILEWLRPFRRKPEMPAHPSAAEIRSQLADLRHRHGRMRADQDAMALAVVNSESAALEYLRLDDEASELQRGIAVLAAALPQAEAKEAETARQAEAASRAKRLQDYERKTGEAQEWVDDLLARLPTGDELTKARDLRDALNTEAIALGLRRASDPLHALVGAMQHRIDRVSRSRWAHGAPITLGGTNTEALTAATARVEALERTRG